MSKQSERKRRKEKAAAILLKSQQNSQNQNTSSNSKAEHSKENPKISSKPKLIDRPSFVGVIATSLGVLAGFFYSINHTSSIWLLFCFLVACAQLIRVELILHDKAEYVANCWGVILCAIALIVCLFLQFLELKPNPFPPAIQPIFQTNFTAKATVTGQFEPFFPAVSLDVGQVVDPKDPWGTGLIVCNQSKDPISNIWAAAYWNDPDGPTKHIIIGDVAIVRTEELLPTLKQGFHFSRFDNASPKSDFPPFGHRTFINIDIRYTPKSLKYETNQVFEFCIYMDSAGNYLWIPDGSGETEDAITARISQQPSRLIDNVPFLDLRMDAFENISQSNKRYPIKMEFSWKNIGGIAANGVYVEWAALDKNYVPRMIWDHHGEGIGGVLWPGAIGRESRIYTESLNQDIFEGVESGKYVLAGTALFKDMEDHTYSMQFRASKTNEDFDVKVVGLGAYFNELMSEFKKNDKFDNSQSQLKI